MKDSIHLRSVIDMMCHYEPLNASYEPGGQYPKEVFDNAIDVSSIFETPQVVYFHLPIMQGGSSVTELARLFLFSLLTAATVRKMKAKEASRMLPLHRRVSNAGRTTHVPLSHSSTRCKHSLHPRKSA